MATWAGRQCGSRFATYAGIGGYRRQRTRQIVHGRSVAQPCGTRAAWTAGLVRRESRRDAAAGRGQMRTYALAVDATSRDCLTGAREMRATPMAMNTADPISS